MHTPLGILKLNFDESFIRSTRSGGIGGVIRVWSGTIVRSFSRPLEALDANEVEVFSLLVDCRGLWRMGCFNPILEGDSFSTIQCGFGNSSYPWRLADWIEEVQDI